jgi:MFS family permease
VSAILLRRLPRQRLPVAPAPVRRLGAEIVAGLRCVLGDRLLATLTAAGGVVNAVYLGQVAILVLFVRQVLGFGPVGYALTLASGAVGAVVGGMVVERVVTRLGRVRTLAAGLGCACLSGFGVLAGTAVTAVAGWAAMGFGVMLWNVVAVSLRQSVVPGELLGRVTGAYRLVAWGTMPAGALIFGAAAGRWGFRAAFGGGGVAIAALALVVVVLLAGDDRLARTGPGGPDRRDSGTGSLR